MFKHLYMQANTSHNIYIHTYWEKETELATKLKIYLFTDLQRRGEFKLP